MLNGHGGYATHAARQSDVIEKELDNGSPTGQASVQGLRRGPGLGAAIEASRSLGMGGYTSTSTGTAAKQVGQFFAGTMDHAWVMTHKNEVGETPLSELMKLRDEGATEELQDLLSQDAFRSFAMAHPESGILLVDTYDPLQGLENAITVIKELRDLGLGKGYGVRFDSGDIAEYSKIALRRFAEEGFMDGVDPEDVPSMTDEKLLKLSERCSVFCAAADGIQEHSAQEMRENGAFFRSWGIGTGGSHVSPLGLVYKAAAVYMDVNYDDKDEMTPVMKVASNAPVKSSNPGKINSRRYYDDNGMLERVVVYDENLGLSNDNDGVNLRDFSDEQSFDKNAKGQDLLVPVFDKDGAYVYDEPPKVPAYPGSSHMVTDLAALTKTIKAQLDTLPDDVRKVVKPREEILKKQLLDAFAQAKADGDSTLSIDIAKLEENLPEEMQHIPVYLDKNLFEQRMSCEEKHAQKANRSGVAEYKERFEGGNAKRNTAVKKSAQHKR